MAGVHPYEKYFQHLLPALKSKVEEFRLLNYGTIDIPSLWEYLTRKKWRKPVEDVHMYQLVADIVSTMPGDYMNYATIESYRSTNWLEEISKEELQELLGTKKN
ncbi:competence protein ComN [Bacillus aerolatus]|uniref:Competence protein ComN n=1 Tax=Bacillus aerolatus TaxID=2653354 RepID=A0A6I1FJ00_9BACI|nr:post-transcriptional regulator [Bacillus aerolatus]KAB7708655.1 competence protein ComN [Bacillus aerolatus]